MNIFIHKTSSLLNKNQAPIHLGKFKQEEKEHHLAPFTTSPIFLMSCLQYEDYRDGRNMKYIGHYDSHIYNFLNLILFSYFSKRIMKYRR